jgi:hypothetical protein
MGGKRLQDLTFLDEGGDAYDLRHTEWYRFAREIDDLLATGLYTWAEDTLRGIQETVEMAQHCTDRQRQAVRHIEESRREDEAARPRTSRRYEGFKGRSR